MKKANREPNTKRESSPPQLQTSQSADASTQQNTFTSITKPDKQTENAIVSLPRATPEPNLSTGETSQEPMVLKKRAIIAEPQNKSILDIQGSMEKEKNTSQNQPRYPNTPFDGISPHFHGKQLTTEDINRFIIEPKPPVTVRFVHNSKFQKEKAYESQRTHKNQLSKSDNQNQIVKSNWQASTSYSSARRIDEQDSRALNFTMQSPSFKTTGSTQKGQSTKKYVPISRMQSQLPNGVQHAHRFKEQAPRAKSKIPKMSAQFSKTESSLEQPKHNSELSDDFSALLQCKSE